MLSLMNKQPAARDSRRSRTSVTLEAPRQTIARSRHGSSCACGGSCPRCQAKSSLEIGAPDDAYEREADAVADRVMRTPVGEAGSVLSARPGLQRKCTACEEEEEEEKNTVRRKPASSAATAPGGRVAAPSSVDSALRSSGKPLDRDTRGFFETRFGQDFSRVRVHSDTTAARSAQDISADAYTVGNSIVFGEGRFAPLTQAGRRLIAHELTHVVQQRKGVRRHVVQRRSGCSGTQDTTITDDHSRARGMLSRAIAAVSSYDGTTPATVFNALSTHFHGATSNGFATWINVNLRFLWATTWMAGYECYTGGLLERGWACGPSDLATTFWCVPTVDIRLCPSYFGQSPTERSTTLIHEWVHKYGCNFDLGYEGEADYPKNWTVTQLLNADSFSSFIRGIS